MNAPVVIGFGKDEGFSLFYVFFADFAIAF